MRKIIFKSVQYENFKSSQVLQTFDLESNGLYGIYGAIGTGKSTKFAAISACLYRKCMTSGDILKLTDMINQTTKRNLYLKLDLSVEENDKTTDYTIITTHNHATEKNRIIINSNVEKVFDSVNKQVEFVENNIMSFQVYNNIVNFTQQNNQTFASLTDSGQKEVFDSILDFSYFDNLKSKVLVKLQNQKSDVSNINTKIEQLNSQIINYKNLIEETNQNYTREKNNCIQEICNIDNLLNDIDINMLNNMNTEIVAEVEEINKKYITLIRNLENQVDNLRTKKSNLETEFTKALEHLSNSKNNITDSFNNQSNSIKNKYEAAFIEYKQTKNDEIQKTNDQIFKYQTDFDSSINSIKQELRDAEKKSSDLKHNLVLEQDSKINNCNKVCDDKIKSIEINISNCSNTISHNKITLVKLNNSLSIDGICPTCFQPVNENHHPKIKEEISKLELQNTKIANDIANLEQEKSKIKESNRQEIENILSNYSHQIKIIESEFANQKMELDHQIQELEKQKSEKINSINMLQEEIKNDIKQMYETLKIKSDSEISIHKESFNKQLEEVNLQIASLKAKHSDLIQEIDSSIFNADSERIKLNNEYAATLNITKQRKSDIEKKIEQYNNLVTEKEKLNSKLVVLSDNVKSQIEKIQNLISDNNSEIANLKSKNLVEAQKTINILEFWNNNLGSTGIKSHIISSMLPFINKELSTILNELFEGRFRVDVSIPESDSGNYKIRIQIVNETSSSVGYKNQSGGEKRIIDYAFIIVLNRLYKHITETSCNILLLDEFFDALDDESSQLVVSMLKQISQNIGIYVITHSEYLKNNNLFDQVEIMDHPQFENKKKEEN